MSEPTGFKKVFDFSLLKRIFQYAAPYKRKFLISIILAIVLAVLAPVRPMVIKYTISHAIQDGLLNLLLYLTIIQIVILLFETALRFYFSFLTAWLGQTVVRDLRIKIYRKVLHLNLSQFDRTPIGTLTTRTINDIEAVSDIFSEGLIPIMADLLSIIALLGAMFWINWKLTLICLIPFPILLIATWYFKESVNKSFIRVRNAVASLNAFVQEHISGMQVVQAFSVENREFEKFRKINREHRNANIRAIFAYSVFFPLVEIILATSMGLLVWFAAIQAYHTTVAEAGEIAGQIVAFILLLNLLFRPLRMVADKFNVVQMGMVASERIFRVMDNPAVESMGGSFSEERIRGEIEFKKIWFAYTDDQFVLKDISFRIPPGETLAIVGHTGSGKTSIISLINGLYPIHQGSILIDGVSLSEWDLHALRRQVGVVLQDVFLFSGSVMDNLTLRNPEIREEAVFKAAKMIGMHDFILRLPGGYQYNVMERGGTLSLGQRQLLSFIRVLLYNPAILILDEATSSVDTESELLIQHAIETLIANRTAIVIAHRLSTIRKADTIMVLDKGEIKEIGTHDELMEKEGFYAGLHDMQFLKKEVSRPTG